MSAAPILLIGGAGLVGSETARSLRAAHPDAPLLIGGRDLDRANALAAKLGNAEALRVDLGADDIAIGDRALSAIVIFVKDDRLGALRYALAHDVPHVGISTGTFEIAPEVAAWMARPSATVVLGSEWLAGAAALTTLHVARDYARLDRIALSAVLDEQDIGGPAADADYERLTSLVPAALTRTEGRYHWRTADDGPVEVQAADGTRMAGFSYSPFDIVSLGARTDARHIAFDIAVGVSSTRRAGEALSTEILVELEGTAADGSGKRTRHALVHPEGQAPLTALALTLILERLTGLDGDPPSAPGLYFPDGLVTPERFVKRALASGATLAELEALP